MGHQTVTIFDWDDTLLCTSWLNDLEDNGEAMPRSVEKHLRGIARVVAEVLELASTYGPVFIITNASEGWVEDSASRWIPELLPVLKAVPIISARSKFEKEFPYSPGMWKIKAFSEMQKQLPGNIVTNLLSIGDSNFEMDAVHAVAAKFDEAIVKTIKFMERPNPARLLKQLELLSSRYRYIAEHENNLKINLERTTSKPNSRTTSKKLGKAAHISINLHRAFVLHTAMYRHSFHTVSVLHSYVLHTDMYQLALVHTVSVLHSIVLHADMYRQIRRPVLHFSKAPQILRCLTFLAFRSRRSRRGWRMLYDIRAQHVIIPCQCTAWRCLVCVL